MQQRSEKVRFDPFTEDIVGWWYGLQSGWLIKLDITYRGTVVDTCAAGAPEVAKSDDMPVSVSAGTNGSQICQSRTGSTFRA